MHVGAVMQCTHAAPATIAPTQPRVLVSGQPIATMSSPMTVTGCLFQIPVGPGTKPSPCLTIRWMMPSTRFLVNGQPAALIPTPGPGPAICQSPEQLPQGPPVVSTVQIRVIGS